MSTPPSGLIAPDEIDVGSLLESIRAAIADGDAEQARLCANRMLEDDALALLEDLEPGELTRLFTFLGDEALAARCGRQLRLVSGKLA